MAVATTDPVLQAAQHGDPAALEALLTANREIVFRYGLRYCRTTEDAEDAVQETLWAAARSIRTFRRAAAITTWLFAIVRNTCHRLVRQHRSEEDLADVLPTLADPRDPLEDQVTAQQIERILANAIARLDADHREETKIICDAMLGWYDQLIANIRAGDTKTHNEQLWDPRSWPKSARGAGFMEAPRGGLGHWIVIENGKIANYQAIVPSTWNSGPRDASNQPGPYEAALAGTPMHDPKQPLEILRTIHSFDPCLACAVHVVDTDGTDLCQIKVL